MIPAGRLVPVPASLFNPRRLPTTRALRLETIKTACGSHRLRPRRLLPDGKRPAPGSQCKPRQPSLPPTSLMQPTRNHRSPTSRRRPIPSKLKPPVPKTPNSRGRSFWNGAPNKTKDAEQTINRAVKRGIAIQAPNRLRFRWIYVTANKSPSWSLLRQAGLVNSIHAHPHLPAISPNLPN